MALCKIIVEPLASTSREFFVWLRHYSIFIGYVYILYWLLHQVSRRWKLQYRVPYRLLIISLVQCHILSVPVVVIASDSTYYVTILETTCMDSGNWQLSTHACSIYASRYASTTSVTHIFILIRFFIFDVLNDNCILRNVHSSCVLRIIFVTFLEWRNVLGR
jgi:hypothetical protein